VSGFFEPPLMDFESIEQFRMPASVIAHAAEQVIELRQGSTPR